MEPKLLLLIGCILAFGENIGLRQMAGMSDLSLQELLTTAHDFIRLETLKPASDLVTNAAARLYPYSSSTISRKKLFMAQSMDKSLIPRLKPLTHATAQTNAARDKSFAARIIHPSLDLQMFWLFRGDTYFITLSVEVKRKWRASKEPPANSSIIILVVRPKQKFPKFRSCG
jgi:hypothetical protein